MKRRHFLQMGLGAAAAFAVPNHARAGTSDLTLNGALALAPIKLGAIEQPVLFLLDTGASVTVVDGSLAGALGVDRFLPKFGPPRVTQTGIAVAGRTGFVSPAIADLKPIATALGAPILGLLGSDFLSAFQVVADFSARRLTLNQGGEARPPNSVPMRFAGIPYADAEVRHGRSIIHGEFGLDTGLDSGVKIKDSVTLPMMGLATVPGTTITMEGAKTVMAGTVDAVRFGGLDVPKVSAIVSQDAPPSGAGSTYAGTIGAPVFQNRVLTLDYPGRWCALSPLIL